MNQCNGIAKATGKRCRILIEIGDYCEWHSPSTAPSDRVTQIEIESTELKPGETKFEKAKQQRPIRDWWNK